MASIRDMEKSSFEQQELTRHSPIQLTSEQFERLLAPRGGPGVQNFGNPTPLGLIAFLLVQAPTAFIQMGWGGSTTAANAVLTGPYYLLGGLALVISGVMEWIIGNTFPSVVAITFGGNWLALATIMDPAHGIASTFPSGTSSPDYNKALMFYFAFWTFLTAVYFITSLRSNIALAGVFFNISFANGLNAAGYGELGMGNQTVANALFKAGGAFEFVVVCFAGYLFVALMLESVKMPFGLPLGDLSNALINKKKLS